MALIPLAVRVDPRQTWFSWQTDQDTRVFRRRVKFTGMAAAATTADIDTLFPGGMVIEGCHISLITAFGGGGSATATLSIGTTASPATYQAALNVFTGQSASGAATFGSGAGIGGYLGGNTTPTAVGTIRIRLTTDTNTNVLTAGVADIFVRLRAYSVKTT